MKMNHCGRAGIALFIADSRDAELSSHSSKFNEMNDTF